MKFQPPAIAALGILLSACASSPATAPVAVAATAPAAAEAASFDRDRAAVLAMLGEYEVSFDFVETAVLAPGYKRIPGKTTGAFETVLLVEDSGRNIVLQHLLVSKDGKHVTKHWRQDWRYEATSRLEFSEDQVWRLKPVAPELSRGAWTQCVYEVSDAPRYCGTGKWSHRMGIATWTSDRSWRPLPRREYTMRNDYNAINAENRHSIVPSGWTHEQDNTKVRREGERSAGLLVREFGFNDYRRTSSFDFSAATKYWAATRDYWAQVRGQWDARIVTQSGLRLAYPVNGTDMIDALFEQAEAVEKGGRIEPSAMTAAFDKWVQAPPAAVALAAVKQ